MPQIGAAIAGIVGAVKTFAASSVIGGFLVRTAVSLGLSLLARALQPKPKAPRQPGIQTEVTTTGGTESQGFVLGRYATGGHLVAPPYSHGTAGGTPNAYLTYIVEVSDIPGVSLSRIIVNDGYTDLGETAHPDYGFPLLAFRDGATDYAWVKFHDGTQTTADPMLVDRYSAHPDRPWTAQHIGTGTAYAIVTFRYNREVFNGLPSVRVELDGIPLYDPRADTTVGGSGAQRWDDPATWQPTDNPAVMIYNILCGITLPDGRIWGGDAEAEALPLSNWFAAMNVCDTDMDGRPQFRAGFEVRVAEDDGAGVIEDLLAACTGQIAEYGGVWRIRIGAPASPVWSLTDDDIIITDPQGFDAFPGLESTYNAIAATYPEPASLWQSREAPPIYNPAWEAEDGDRRLVASLTLPACPYVAQVGQVMEAYIKDQRRFRSHTMVLPPDASILEPLDTISWTSDRNGYVSKVFEVMEVTSRTGTLCQEVLLRECDPEDYDYDPVNDLPQPADQTGTTPPAPQPVESWAVTGTTITDGLAVGRRPALLLEWSGTAAEDADFVRYEVRLTATGAVIASGLADREAGRVLIAQGILPVTEYEARGRYVLDRPTEWSSWLSATTPDVRFGADDFDALADIFADQGLSAPEIVNSLPAIGNFEGRLAFLTTDGLLYRYTSGAWTAEIAPDQISAGTAQIGLIAAAGVLAESIIAGQIQSDYLLIRTLLEIDAANAGLSVGKETGTDFLTPGLYAGTDGAGGFSLLAGRVGSDDRAQALEIGASRGLRLLNARHAVTAELAPPGVNVTTDQTYDLPAGTTSLTLQIIGGGGAGESVSAAGVRTPGGDGGPTRVELWDGTTDTGIFWEAAGGAGGESGVTPSGKDGQSSVAGSGGIGAYSYQYVVMQTSEGPEYATVNVPAAAGIGFGAGGGAGRNGWTGSVIGHGGRAASLIEINDYDVSALTDPKLVITIGAAGQKAGETVDPNQGANGSPGRVRLFANFTDEITADVVPLVSTMSGTFDKEAASATLRSFPDLGPGLWHIWNPANAGLGLDELYRGSGNPMALIGVQAATFFASETPTYITSSSLRTLAYEFSSMGEWGGA